MVNTSWTRSSSLVGGDAHGVVVSHVGDSVIDRLYIDAGRAHDFTLRRQREVFCGPPGKEGPVSGNYRAQR